MYYYRLSEEWIIYQISLSNFKYVVLWLNDLWTKISDLWKFLWSYKFDFFRGWTIFWTKIKQSSHCETVKVKIWVRRRSSYMSFFLCISWHFSNWLQMSVRSCRFENFRHLTTYFTTQNRIKFQSKEEILSKLSKRNRL